MGIREAPFFGTPTVNVGTRQTGRSRNPHLVHVDADVDAIRAALGTLAGVRLPPVREFGDGGSDARFLRLLDSGVPWSVPVQKHFQEAP
jgi:UDP-N-acetylglucosamine 2-epimerase (hydrolysing)